MHRRHSNYPVSVLIAEVLEQSGLKASLFIKSLGYGNVSSGLRRLAEWLEKGEGTADFIDRLIEKTSLPKEKLALALSDTKALKKVEQTIAELAAEATARRRFRPYLFIETEQERPGSLIMAAITGFQMKTIELPPSVMLFSEEQSLPYIKKLIEDHLEITKGNCQLYGKITGYRFIESWEESIRFDLNGNPVSRDNTHFAPPWAILHIGHKTLTCAANKEPFLKLNDGVGNFN